MKYMTKLNRVTLALSFIPVIVLALCWTTLPDLVPTNWGIHGEVNYSGKGTLIWLAGLCPLLAVAMPVTVQIDPRRKNIEKFRGAYDLFCLATTLLLVVCNGITVIESYRPNTVNVQVVVLIGVGILFILLGNYMPRFRHNYFCGIRTPWTLASETVWTKTHRLFGRLMFVLGVVMLPAAFLPGQVSFWIIMGGAVGISAAAYVYSYLVYKKEHAEK